MRTLSASGLSQAFVPVLTEERTGSKNHRTERAEVSFLFIELNSECSQ